MSGRKGVLWLTAVFGMLLFASNASAESATAKIGEATESGAGAQVGLITFEDSKHGLLVKPDLTGLEAGPHGVHVHEFPDCSPAKSGGMAMPATAAGGHFDPKKTEHHGGPYGDGHLGDLPNIFVEHDGTARIPVLAPRLRVADVKDRAVVVHAGADRYTTHAQHHHGKGGARMYCGVIK